MSAHYDFCKNPSPKESKKRPCYHARVVPHETVSTEALANKIHTMMMYWSFPLKENNISKLNLSGKE